MSDPESPVVWRFTRHVVAVPVPLPAPNPCRKRPSQREQFLTSKFFAHQAVEAGSDDESLPGSANSEDDDEESDLSCITDASVSVDDDDMAIYRESLSSQAGVLGFGTPMAGTRRERFKSTFDQSRTPTSDFTGTICPQNHMCRSRTYRTPNHACDLCDKDIEEGTIGICHSSHSLILLCHMLTGERCSLCDYDLCCECSKPLNTLVPDPALALLVSTPTVSTLAPGPTLLPPLFKDMSQYVPAPAPSFPAPHLNLFPIFNVAQTALAPVSMKVFPMFVKRVVRPELKLKFVQNPYDPMLLKLPAWQPTVHPQFPRVSRMKLPGVHRSLTPIVFQPLPSLSASFDSSLVIID